MSKNWTVTYTKDGKEHTMTFSAGDDMPSENEAAIAVRNQVMADVALVDRTSGQSNNTVVLLEFYGYKIVGIEETSAAS